MPHDRDGALVEVGDYVLILAKVKAVHLTEDYCNLDLETKINMPPTNQPLAITLNSRQVIRDGPGPSIYPPPCKPKGTQIANLHSPPTR